MPNYFLYRGGYFAYPYHPSRHLNSIKCNDQSLPNTNPIANARYIAYNPVLSFHPQLAFRGNRLFHIRAGFLDFRVNPSCNNPDLPIRQARHGRVNWDSFYSCPPKSLHGWN